MSKNNFSSIRNLGQLEEASRKISEQLHRQSDHLSMDVREVRSFYTPVNLYNSLMERVSPALNVAGFVVDLYDRIKENIAWRRSQRHASATASDTATCPSDDAGNAPAPDATLQPEN